MTAKHTPGPWTAFTGWSSYIGIQAAENGSLASVPRERGVMSDVDVERAEADAALIAAAPELLEALHGLLHAPFAHACACPGEWVESAKGESRHWEKDRALPCAVCRARAAIAKAEGK